MFKTVFRVIGLLVIAWLSFVAGAAILAAMKRRDGVPQDPKADEVDLVANFEALEFHSESAAVRGGSVTTWFGGGSVDLRDATLDPAGATFRVSSVFGGVNLIVPDEWTVESHITGLGGVGDGRPKVERDPGAPTLRLEGTALFGGWGITSEPAGRDRPELVTV